MLRLALALVLLGADPGNAAVGRIRVGFFLGGRTNALLRAAMDGAFEREGLDVTLHTANLHDPALYEVPKSLGAIKRLRRDGKLRAVDFAKLRGTEVADAIARGEVEAGTVGESSFIQSVCAGKPIVALALLGFSARGQPAQALAIRSDEVIKSTADFKGKVLATRRGGPADYVFLMEFLRSIGLDKDKSVTVVSQVADDQIRKQLVDKQVDGGFYHITTVVTLESEGLARVYRPFDWVDPEMSQALLVFRRDFLEKNPDLVQRFVTAYVKRLALEKTLPDRDADRGWRKETMMRSKHGALMVPQYALPPRVRPELLEAMQQLLLRYGFIPAPADLRAAIDNRFVDAAMASLAIPPAGPLEAR